MDKKIIFYCELKSTSLEDLSTGLIYIFYIVVLGI